MPRILLCLVPLLLLACQDGGEPAGGEGTSVSPDSVQQAEAQPADAQPETAAATPGPPPERIAASHVLVSYEGAAKAQPSIRRSRSAALQRAQEVRRRLLQGEDLSELAKSMSDCPSGRRGGFLGGFAKGAMHPAFEEAAFALQRDRISAVVETPFGFHVIRREAYDEIHVAQIMVQWKGIARARAKRDKTAARQQAEQALTRLEAGEPFADVARDLSDGAAGLRGGDLGWFTRGQFLPDFEEAAFALAPGERSRIFETAAGFHIVQRLE